jgi:hypothetical protein
MSKRPHNISGRVLSWPYCTSCGLIAMRNAASRRALSEACEGKREVAVGEAADRLFAKLKREGWS